MGDQSTIPSTKTYYSAASRRHAKQTRNRARRERLEKERRRLIALGADPAWLDRVFRSD